MADFLKMIVILLVYFTVSFCHPVPSSINLFSTIEKANKGVPDLYEGDMRLSVEQRYYRKRNPLPENLSAFLNINTKWPNNNVPYMISSAFSETDKCLIREAMRDIERATCVTYEELSTAPKDKSYIHIKDDSGCWSYVGWVFTEPGQEQPLSISRGGGCVYKDIITHELVHALGAWHEQSRPDRDNYVTIHFQNVYPGTEGNFEKQTDIWDRFTPYDPDSIMHYDNYGFSKNDKMTITWNADPSRKLGGSVLSPIDIDQLNAFYNCAPITGPTTTTKTNPPKTTTTSTTTSTSTTTRAPKTTTTTSKTPSTTSTKSSITTSTITSKPTTTTRRPTSSSTTVQPIEDCGDKDFLTCIYAYRQPSRFCAYEKYRTTCPQSCGVCDGGNKIQCVNFKDNPIYDCFQKNMDQQCTSTVLSVRKLMKINCPKTCCEAGNLYK